MLINRVKIQTQKLFPKINHIAQYKEYIIGKYLVIVSISINVYVYDSYCIR